MVNYVNMSDAGCLNFSSFLSRSTTDVYNYRPLTVLTSMCGLYTKLLNERLANVVETHKLLGEIQNGFRKKRLAWNAISFF